MCGCEPAGCKRYYEIREDQIQTAQCRGRQIMTEERPAVGPQAQDDAKAEAARGKTAGNVEVLPPLGGSGGAKAV